MPVNATAPCNATEALRARWVKNVKEVMESSYNKAELVDLMFLYNVLMTYEIDAGTITRDCVLANACLERIC